MNTRSTSIAIAALLSASAAMAESITCETHVITEGDSRAALLEHCGEPEAREGNRWHYRHGQDATTVVHFDGDTISLIEIRQD